MRTIELEKQISEIESQLRNLIGGAPSELWALVPLSTLPCPPTHVVEGWLAAIGVEGLKVCLVPSRHKARALVVQTPGYTGGLDGDGWTLVSIGECHPYEEIDGSPATAWHHPQLVAAFHEYLEKRDAIRANWRMSHPPQ